jgi:hypothetical protein
MRHYIYPPSLQPNPSQRTGCAEATGENGHVSNGCSYRVSACRAELCRGPKFFRNVEEIDAVGTILCISITPREDGHAPYRYSCRIVATHAELICRPRLCYTVVHVHSIDMTCIVVTPREHGHSSNGCSCKIAASHAQLSRRPHPCCTVVQIHDIGVIPTHPTPREYGNAADRCSCQRTARHAELSRRPCPCCTVV